MSNQFVLIVYQSITINMLSQNLQNDYQFTDVTLVCEYGQSVQAHKGIHSAPTTLIRNIYSYQQASNPPISLWSSDLLQKMVYVFLLCIQPWAVFLPWTLPSFLFEFVFSGKLQFPRNPKIKCSLRVQRRGNLVSYRRVQISELRATVL